MAVIDSYSSSNQNDEYEVDDASSSGQLYQTFEGDGNTLEDIDVYIRRTTTALANQAGYIEIYAHTGTYGSTGEPTGSVLATSDIVNSDTFSTSLTMENFAFSGGEQITLSDSTYYCLVLRVYSYSGHPTEGGSVFVGVDTSSPTHGGNIGFNDTLAPTKYIAGTDMIFTVNGSGGTTTSVSTSTSSTSTSTTQSTSTSTSTSSTSTSTSTTQSTSTSSTSTSTTTSQSTSTSTTLSYTTSTSSTSTSTTTSSTSTSTTTSQSTSTSISTSSTSTSTTTSQSTSTSSTSTSTSTTQSTSTSSTSTSTTTSQSTSTSTTQSTTTSTSSTSTSTSSTSTSTSTTTTVAPSPFQARGYIKITRPIAY